MKDEVETNSWYTWVIGIAICLNVWIIGAIVTYAWADWYFVGDRDNIDNNKAIFGDSFGAVNALISAFAFGAMIVTFYFQRYELKLQRKELEAQRMEFEQQNQTLGLQRFENTFFNMLKLQQEIVAGLEYTPFIKFPNATNPRLTYKGREVFKYIYENNVKSAIESEGINSYCKSKDITLLYHYFRHLYTILCFIDNSSDIDKFYNKSLEENFSKKYEYARILRATMSRYELILLYYDGLSDFGKDKMKPIIEKFSMLKNINKDLLALSNDAISYSEGNSRFYFNKNCLAKDYPPTDYLFFITDSVKNVTHYNVSAFYHQKEDQKKEMEKKSKFHKELNELMKQP